jgi:plastocyanin
MTLVRGHPILKMLTCGALLMVATSAAAAPQTYTLVIDKMKFGSVPSQLHKGDAIIWVNHDMLRHSATATSHAFDVDLPPGASKKLVLTKAGTFPFTCRYHPGMRGSFEVR